MKELHNPELIRSYLTKYKIMDLFESRDLEFRLIEYAPGEIINSIHPADRYLKFSVHGDIEAYVIREDGSRYRYFRGNSFNMWGNVEFCGFDYTDHFQEAITPVHMLELSVSRYKRTLLQDKTFLWFLARSLATNVYRSSLQNPSQVLPLETQLLNYLETTSTDGSFTGVENMANYLHCSRSQLQKVLRKLMEEGRISKEKKGTYRLNL